MKAIKKLRKQERPRERLISYGPQSLSDAELLSIILRAGGPCKNALELASELLEAFGGFRGFEDATISEISGFKYVGMVKAVQIKACIEIAKRYAKESLKERFKIKSKEDVVKFCKEKIMPYMRDMKKEVFKVILLDSKNGVIKVVDVSVGTLDVSIAHPREILRDAIKEAASGLIIVHNHPSGDPSPSPEDMLVTERISSACKIVGIRFLDHVIIGDNRSFSFLENGLIKNGK